MRRTEELFFKRQFLPVANWLRLWASHKPCRFPLVAKDGRLISRQVVAVLYVSSDVLPSGGVLLTREISATTLLQTLVRADGEGRRK